MTIEVSSTDKRDGKALALFATCDKWQQGHTKTGRSFFAIPGSEAGLFHMTDARECSCPDFQRRGVACKHVRAVRFWLVAFECGAVAPKQRPTTPTVTDDAGTGDNLVTLTPEGAAALVTECAPITTYALLYPTCRVAGCQNDPEPRSQDCYRHQLVDAF